MPVPVIVSVGLPRGVIVDVVTVNVELTPALIEVGLSEADAPAGTPVAAKVIVPVAIGFVER